MSSRNKRLEADDGARWTMDVVFWSGWPVGHVEDEISGHTEQGR